MQINIPDEFLPFIQKNIDVGSFRSPDHLVSEALRAFKEHEDIFKFDRDAFDESIDKALQDIKEGNGISLEQIKRQFDLL